VTAMGTRSAILIRPCQPSASSRWRLRTGPTIGIGGAVLPRPTQPFVRTTYLAVR